MHPFSIREALLAKHAQHVVLIHFPIALFLTGVAFDFIARWTKANAMAMAAAAYYNFVVAALSTPAVVASGLLAWHFQLEGQQTKGILLQHLVLGVASSSIICIVAYLHFRARRTRGTLLTGYLLLLELASIGMVALTGHLGGFLSGVNVQG